MKMECPNCGGNIIYILGSDKVYCEYCNQKIAVSKINISEFTKYVEDIKSKKEHSEENKDYSFINKLLENNGAESIPLNNQNVYKCSNCDSVFIHNDFFRGNLCPYCFSDSKQKGENVKKYEVSKIIPFTLSKNNVSNIICNSVESYEFTPEYVHAMYAPFLASYDEVEATGIAKKNGTNKKYTLKEKIISLKYIGRSIDKELAESIIDYDFSKCQEFDSKFFNESIILDEIYKLYNKEDIKNKIVENVNHEIYIKDNLRFVSNMSINSITNLKEEIWLLPIYIFKEKLGGQINTLLVNGQNGRISGNAVNHSEKNKVTKTFVLLYCVFILVIFIKLFLSLGGQINTVSMPLIVFFVGIIVLFVEMLRSFKFNKIRNLKSKGYKFYGINWDKDIRIS